jgi:hypothetical protein
MAEQSGGRLSLLWPMPGSPIMRIWDAGQRLTYTGATLHFIIP